MTLANSSGQKKQLNQQPSGGSSTAAAANPQTNINNNSNSIERIALFNEGSESTGLPAFQPIEILQAQQACIEAYCLLHGHGIEPNVEDATRWFNKAAALGEARAFFALGEMQERGIGCRVNMLEATELYKKAAKLGDANA